MRKFPRSLLPPAQHALAPWVLAAVLSGCMVGPNFVKPTPEAPDDWMAWHSGDPTLKMPVGTGENLSPEWWRSFDDPVFDRLLQHAFEASPDLLTASLHFSQARVQRRMVDSQREPRLDAAGAVNRQRLSENGAGSRVIRAIAGAQAEPFITLVSEPFTLYQAGFDASWELDLWGRVRRSVEAADTDVAYQAALLDLARLSVASEVAQNYFELRTTQQQIRLAREDIGALQERLGLLDARVRAGVVDHLDLDRQGAELAGLKAQLPTLLAQESVSANRIALLLGAHPGTLALELQARAEDPRPRLPDLAAGLPSELARRRPDIRAAEARLHRATANIGIGQADLYPSIRIGAHFGTESYLAGAVTDWGSRAWAIGPSISLPIFDQGRRRGVVQLRELEQQEAAVAYQRTVLQAWQEVDDALSGYAAETQRLRDLEERSRMTRDSWGLTQARYNAGTVDSTVVLDTQRAYLQARRDMAASQGRLHTRFVAIHKAIGNVPRQVIGVSESRR
ncbi:MAG: efflux transporter outer membrane subunit [Burkholderiaceae bacterium]